MKWIYSMIADESYERFKQLYIKCVLTDSTSFNFGGKTYVKAAEIAGAEAAAVGPEELQVAAVVAVRALAEPQPAVEH